MLRPWEAEDNGNPLVYRTNYNEIYVHVLGSNISIIQSCTALQSILIFIGAILTARDPSRQKWMALGLTVPIIYGANLFRNVGIFYMVDNLGWSFNFAHHQVGKAGSFVAMLGLAFLIFRYLPSLLDDINGLIDLVERRPPGEEPSPEDSSLDGEDSTSPSSPEETPQADYEELDDGVDSEPSIGNPPTTEFS